MDLKSTSSTQFFFFLLFLLLSISTAALQFQVLRLGFPPHPRPQTKFPDLLSDGHNSTFLPQEAQRGFLIELNHVNALVPNASSEDLLQQRLLRDAHRVKSLMLLPSGHTSSLDQAITYKGDKKKGFSSPVASGMALGSGEYFTRIGVGNPVQRSYLVIDTGSDISWLQCVPCSSCYNQLDKIYNPSHSNTSRRVRCGSRICKSVESNDCKSNICHYMVSYGDGSVTTGDMRTETLSFQNGRIDAVPIGCGHKNEGLFVSADGLLGLGRGSLSFPSRVRKTLGPKFSYCLVDRSSLSKSYLMFGELSVSRKAIFTRLLTNFRRKTFYYVDLTGFSVGGVSVQVNRSVFKFKAAGSGGVIIDSGTSVTRLVREAYEALRDAFRVRANLRKAGEFSLFDTCFDLSGLTTVKVPTVAFHFGPKMKLPLPPENYVIPVDMKGTHCFAFAASEGQLSIIGNIQQQGIRVVFDLAGKQVGFAPNSC